MKLKETNNYTLPLSWYTVVDYFELQSNIDICPYEGHSL